MHGQAYLAETSIGREIAANERVKVVCASSKAADTVARRPSAQ
jgi:hypothetical protein